jgi:transposase-like protein
MPEHRRQFSPQFKAEAVQMVIETGKPVAEVARDLGIHDGTLGNWVNVRPRLPHPRRGTQRLSDRSNRCMTNNPRNCPRSLTQLTFRWR